MLFNSYKFIFLFLPCFLLVYWLLQIKGQAKLAKLWTVLSSLFFYALFSQTNALILIFSILFNFGLSKLIHQKPKRSLILLGVGLNVALLCVFKYSFLQNILIPIGISFYTLQQIAYLVDVHQGLIAPPAFLDYLFSVTYFPTVVSGPITSVRSLIKQVPELKMEHFQKGIFLFVLGLSKKILIAELFAQWANEGFKSTTSLPLIAAWKTSISYTFQVYFVFSGYSDMAIAVALMMGFTVPANFNSPFKAKNIIDFWSRWHMTLTQFINAYIFTPLVRAMPSITFQTTMVATFLAMFIAGVWHGSNINFALYGAMHGFALIINHIRKKKKLKMKDGWAIFWTLSFVNASFVLFRANTPAHALQIFKGMIGLNGVVVPKIGIKSVGMLSQYGFSMGTYLKANDYLLITSLVAVWYLLYRTETTAQLLKKFSPTPKVAMVLSVLFTFCLFGLNQITEFIYFNF
jgi:alginate O-acetyltransferase complex protein AlgI